MTNRKNLPTLFELIEQFKENDAIMVFNEGQ
jgi:hypothetical protein